MDWDEFDVEAALRPQTDDVPEGWESVADLMQRWGKSESRTAEIVKKLTEDGKLERREFTILRGKTVRAIPHYRPMKN